MIVAADAYLEAARAAYSQGDPFAEWADAAVSLLKEIDRSDYSDAFDDAMCVALVSTFDKVLRAVPASPVEGDYDAAVYNWVASDG